MSKTAAPVALVSGGRHQNIWLLSGSTSEHLRVAVDMAIPVAEAVPVVAVEAAAVAVTGAVDFDTETLGVVAAAAVGAAAAAAEPLEIRSPAQPLAACTVRSAADGRANVRPDTATVDYFDTANSGSIRSTNCSLSLEISAACTDRNTTESCSCC